jgi:hypothetical protein
MSKGRYLPLSPPRRWVGDLLAVTRGVPLVPFERRMNLAEVVEARQDSGVSWPALFVKAFALVAHGRPELRRSHQVLPWPRLYEHPVSVAIVAVEREWQGENAVFFGPVCEPENKSLREIDGEIRRLKAGPLEKVRHFRRLLRVTRLPRPLRRLIWWYGCNVFGSVRARYFGTFGLSVTASSGAAALSLVSPTTTTLHYGLIEANGDIDVRATFDHRVLDGAPIARALADLEEVLNGAMVKELAHLKRRRQEAVRAE